MSCEMNETHDDYCEECNTCHDCLNEEYRHLHEQKKLSIPVSKLEELAILRAKNTVSIRDRIKLK